MESSTSFLKHVKRRLHYWATWRCQEPVIIFESDDWGLKRHNAQKYLKGVGEPSEWANEELETLEDLEALYNVLEAFRDKHGRPAVFTANFIVANPDFDTIVRDGFRHYADIGIHEMRSHREKWIEGFKRRVFFPQYHGRSHFCVDEWLKDLKMGEKRALALFNDRCAGGVTLLEKEGWRYHSEYLNWHLGKQWQEEEMRQWIAKGIQLFEQTFGFKPLSTVAPHYIFTKATAKIWKEFGLRYIQGTSYRLYKKNKNTHIQHHVLGETSPEGFLMMGRTVKFDPRPERKAQNFDGAWKQIESCFRYKIPAIIDTHRINYTGKYRQEGLKQLQELLKRANQYQPRYLTSVELGEAIFHQGHYFDPWNKKELTLCPLDRFWNYALRKCFESLHASIGEYAYENKVA